MKRFWEKCQDHCEESGSLGLPNSKLPISLLNGVDEKRVKVNHLSLDIIIGFGVEKFVWLGKSYFRKSSETTIINQKCLEKGDFRVFLRGDGYESHSATVLIKNPVGTSSWYVQN